MDRVVAQRCTSDVSDRAWHIQEERGRGRKPQTSQGPKATPRGHVGQNRGRAPSPTPHGSLIARLWAFRLFCCLIESIQN